MMQFRMKIIFSCMLFILFFSTLVMLAATIGSDSSPTRFNTQQTLNNGDRVAGFAALYGGFAFANSGVTATFDSFFQVSGNVDLNVGTLVLNQDLILADVVNFNSLGNIVGQGHALEFSSGMTLIPFLPASACFVYSTLNQLTVDNLDIFSIDWSVSDTFIAVGVANAAGKNTVEIWQWNNDANTLTFKSGVNPDAQDAKCVRWHPTSNLLAVGTVSNPVAGQSDIWMYSVDWATGVLTNTSSAFFTGGPVSVAWHPSGAYLAAGGTSDTGATNRLRVFPVSSDGVFGTPVGFNPGVDVSPNCGLSWDSTSTFLAVGYQVSANPELVIYRFNISTLALTSVVGVNQTVAVNAVDWHPTMPSILAVGLNTTTGSATLLYDINTTTSVATLLTSLPSLGLATETLHWSSSGSCLAIGTSASIGSNVYVYSFNPANYSFTLVNSFAPGNFQTNAVRWSRTLTNLASGGADNIIYIYRNLLSSIKCFNWSDLYLSLNSDITLYESCIVFSGVSEINGGGHALTLTPGSRLYLNQDSTLLMKDLAIKGVNNSVIEAYDNSSTFSFSNTQWVLDGNYTFTKGKFDVIDDFVISGSGYTFSYQSQGISKIYGDNGNMIIDEGVVFSYEPVTANNNLIQLMAPAAQITLRGSTLRSATIGLQLTMGTLLVDRTSNIINDSFVLGQEINFGDGLNSSNNLNIEILPAATLNVLSGCVTANDV